MPLHVKVAQGCLDAQKTWSGSSHQWGAFESGLLAGAVTLDSPLVSIERCSLCDSIRLWRQPVSSWSGAGKMWVWACPSLPAGLVPLKLGLGSMAWEPGSLLLAGGEGSWKGAQSAAPVRAFLSPVPRAYSPVAPCQRQRLTGWQACSDRRHVICDSWPLFNCGQGWVTRTCLFC